MFPYIRNFKKNFMTITSYIGLYLVRYEPIRTLFVREAGKYDRSNFKIKFPVMSTVLVI